MCAILDANVAGEVFGTERPAAGAAFFKWIDSGRGRLIVGGRLLGELDRNGAFRVWRQQAALAGRVKRLPDDAVDDRMQKLQDASACRSNDEHVVALALVGGARLLYSNDRDLQLDFKDKNVIDAPRGRVYSTRGGGELTRQHRSLLANRYLCARNG